MRRELGIFLLLVTVAIVTTAFAPVFCLEGNLTNLLQRTALFGILGVGVAFVIITGGIDLSIGSVVGLVGTLMPLLLFDHGWTVGSTLAFVLGLSLVIGLVHGLLITKVGMPPFVVTLCGLLVYRGLARWLTDDHNRGFGQSLDDGLRQLAIARPCSLPVPGIRWIAEGNWSSQKVNLDTGEPILDVNGAPIDLPFWGEVAIPLPFLILIGVSVLAWAFLDRTIWGRYLLALGRSEEAARYSGIKTDRMVISAYVICAGLAGLGGVLFALDVNTVNPTNHGSFFELYAIAAAVLGGCSLRGGQGSILGVVIGAAVMRVLYNAINLTDIPTTLEFAIIGIVLLAGVGTDTIVRRMVSARRRRA